jgi:hypothetical protein
MSYEKGFPAGEDPALFPDSVEAKASDKPKHYAVLYDSSPRIFISRIPRQPEEQPLAEEVSRTDVYENPKYPTEPTEDRLN